ncbi:MAG: peroxiredoxin family protein [Patescibacteria group bacterium]|nr:peroxiredoxin family protein [Patescibacteria group bacterium]
MNSPQKHTLIIATEVIIAVVILASIFAKTTSKQTTNQSSQTNQANTANNSMADHHKSKPVNSAVFDALLGKQAPDFTLSSYEGNQISLKDYRGKNVLLFFNEGLMCYPACWNQIVAFGKDDTFKSKNTVILNITVDSKDDWKKAIDKMPELAGNTVLLDPNREVSNLYGVLALNSSMHRGQFPGHTYVLVDKEGIVRFVKDDAQMAVRNQELLAEVAKL